MADMQRLATQNVRLEIDLEQQTWTFCRANGEQWGQTTPRQPWLLLEPLPLSGDTAGWPEPQALYLYSIEQVDEALCTRFATSAGAPANLALYWRLRGDVLQVYVVPDKGYTMPDLELCCAGLASDQVLVPVRMGLLLHGDADTPFNQMFGTYEYEGVHMAMCGLLRGNASLMATWGDSALSVRVWRDLAQPAPVRMRTAFRLRDSARALELSLTGTGGLTSLAAAYRARAEALGYRQTWQQKIAREPSAAKLIGACNVKLWTALARYIDENLVETGVDIHWTFDEAAQVAEHLKRDVQVDDCLFHLGGWTRYGYDCRHPDIMPPNPECGGEAGLVDCAHRVQACGYLFCLHDNYQDMYRDAPSWDPDCLERKADGSPVMGGVWLGGRAYYTCAQEAIKLAKRPQNLPAVRRVIAPDLYFIDTTYAVGPQTCYDPHHPLTRAQDIACKAELSDYARGEIGMFGSECGREWAIPHAEFFEGLVAVSGHYFHSPSLEPANSGGTVVPFFEMVYRDCIALHGKYDHNLLTTGEQVLHHALMGRPLYYHFHQSQNHLYWQREGAFNEAPAAEDAYDPAAFTRAGNGWADGMCLLDRYVDTQEILGPLHKLTAETLVERFDLIDAGRLLRRTTFGNGVTVTANMGRENVLVTSALGGDVNLPPLGLLVEAPTFTAFRALSWGGQAYAQPVLFTLTSLDDRPLARSASIRVYHGQGEAHIMVRGELYSVQREAVI